MTIAIQIGNTDDKLSQHEWSRFCQAIKTVIAHTPGATIHYAGASAADAPWQNAAWILDLAPAHLAELPANLARVGRIFGQNAIALTEGKTVFV